MRFVRDKRGQEMIEYALASAMVALAAGAILTPITPLFSRIMSKVVSVLVKFGGA